MKDRYYDKIDKGALNKMRKLPKVHARIRIFAFEYNMHKHGILTPSISFRT